MNKHPYIIMAPQYRHNSAGIRAMYELHRHLLERGLEVKITQGELAPPGSIAVYPETIPGNPMCGETVVRYVLFYPGVLGGDKVFGSREVVFTYNKRFYDAPVLTVPVIEDFFKDEGLKRSGSCYWVGKGTKKYKLYTTNLDSVATEITLDWPASRQELARLFNKKKIFYTYDDCTALIAEAKRCGCRVFVISGENTGTNYDESIKDFDHQLDEFIRITQEAAEKEIKLSFGVMVNSIVRLDMVLRQSGIQGDMKFIKEPESATVGLNKLLDIIEEEGSDIAVLCHQDMYFRAGWIDQVKDQIMKLPDSWVVAGVIGKDMNGLVCGKYRDMRIPQHFDTSSIHEFPHPACCFDEAVIIVNMKTRFRFDETMDGFDLYGTLCVLQAWEMGGTAWVIDAVCEHYCLRPFTWMPDELFIKNFKWLHDRFEMATRLDTTAIGEVKDQRRFETSAA